MSQFAAQPAASVMPEELLYGVDGAIATVTLNAPQRMNTISGPMLRQLTDALVRANEDRDVRVVILTGTGRAFCAGLNLEAQSKGTDNLSVGSGATPTNIDLRNTPPPVLHAMDKPVIAALNGSAAGYGLDLALGADIRVMAQSAKLAASYAKRGVLPESGGTWYLPRMLGWAKAAELIFTGRTLTRRAVAGDRPGEQGRARCRGDGRGPRAGARDRGQRAARHPGRQAHDAHGLERAVQRARPPCLPAAPAADADRGHEGRASRRSSRSGSRSSKDANSRHPERSAPSSSVGAGYVAQSRGLVFRRRWSLHSATLRFAPVGMTGGEQTA